MKKLAILMVSVFSILSLGIAFAAPAGAQVNVFPQCAAGVDSEVCKDKSKLFGPGSVWNSILNTLTFVIGAVSVLMIVIGGLRYTLSNGDQTGINNAKNTILYAIVGLIVAVMANAIVNFVLTNI